MDCDALRDDPWDRIKDFVPGGRKGKRGPRITGNSSTHCYGWPVPAATGAICRNGLAD